MLDTVAIGVQVGGVKPGDLLARGWDVFTKTNDKGGDLWASCQLGGVRLAYMAGIGWLGAEASLPSLKGVSNSQLLEPGQCAEAVNMVRDVASAAVGMELPGLDEWTVSRFDPVWAWDRDPGAYVGALLMARLPRTEPVHYGSSVRWVTRSNRVRARCYDKAKEQGHAVDLPLRLERQIRRRETLRVDGQEVPRTVAGALTEQVCLGVIRESIMALGLDRPIPSIMATRRLLVDTYGRAGKNAYSCLRDVFECGGVWPSDVSRWTKRKYERMYRDAGVSVVSPIGELPGLELPSF